MSKTNPRLNSLIADLKAAARSLAVRLGRRRRALEKPRAHTRKSTSAVSNDTLRKTKPSLCPELLGSGDLQKDVTVAAVDFSGTAETKIDQVGEAVHSGRRLKTPDGTHVRVIR
ncbi:50S ribosomal protein L18e [Halogeometricum sp. wsp3]|nr:50S ribosomal protein L18e [Halogeometricum sp. wsp3]